MPTFEIPRVPGPPLVTTPDRSGSAVPRALKRVSGGVVRAAYTPRTVEKAILSSGGLQEFTCYPATPLWLMSPGLRVYRKKDIFKFHGYVESVVPDDLTPGEEPTATMTIIAGQE